jgi:Leucine-rich repeat (LRR) protein
MWGRMLCTVLILTAAAGLCRADIPADERAALIALYDSTGGDAWTNNSGWKTPPLHSDGFALPGTEGTWKGITVTDGRVKSIQLFHNQLTGTLPAAIGQLTGLSYLGFSDATFSGRIPSEIGNLTALTFLTLTNCQLSGPLPLSLGNLNQLIYLALDNNDLSGQLPDSLVNLNHLKQLSIGDNSFSGDIPAWLAGLTQLEQLSLWGNQFTGSLPGFLGGLSQLRGLNIGYNPLTGPFPAEWTSLTHLETLDLAELDLAGPVPPEIGALASLKHLSMPRCQLTGPLPGEWASLSQLSFLNLTENQLTGSIPSWLGSLNSLTSLYLSENQFNGSIPPELADLSALTQLDLSHNDLTGPIPAGIWGLSDLTSLYLNGNQLSGNLPPEMGGLTKLVYLDLSDNQLSGSIPSQMGSLVKLRELLLARNKLNGTIPLQLGNMSELRRLDLESNNLGGWIPQNLASLTNLYTSGLSLDYNALYAESDLLDFIDAHGAAGFLDTQTLPPTDLEFTCDSPDVILSWTPMGDVEHEGGYRIYRTGNGNPTFIGSTTPKSTQQYTLTNIVPGVPYQFRVTSYTLPHEYNTNQVGSFYSDPVDVFCGTFEPTQRLYFPRMGFDPGAWAEGYGFVNPNAADAAVRFTAFAADGQTTAQAAPMAWYAGEQGAAQIDGVLDLTSPTDGWVLAESNQPGLLGFFLTQHFTDAGLVGLDGAEVLTEGTTDGIILRVAATGTCATDVIIANPGDAAVTATVSGLDGTQEIFAAPVAIPARGFWKFDAAAVIGEAFDGCLHIQSTGPVIGHATVRDGDASIASVNLRPVSDAATELYAAHVVRFPGVYATQIQLLNVNPMPVTATLTFYLADGSQFGTPLQVQVPALQVVSVSDAELGLPAGENTEGWLRVSCPGPLMGCLTFGNPVDNHYMSTLPLQAAGGDDIYFAQVANGNVGGVNFFTGLAVINPNASPVDITICVYESDGDRNGNVVNRTLAPREKYVRLLKSIEGIGGLFDQSSGYIHVTAEGGDVFSFVLFGNDALDFLSAVPAQFRQSK